MKKRITSIFEPAKRNAGIILLACALVMTLAAGSSIAVEQQAEGYTYLAVTSGYSPYTRIPGVPRGTDDSRIIQVTLTQHFTPFPLELPEGSGDAEEYAFVGVYVTFDEPFETEELDGYTSLVMPDGVLTCKDIEIIGPLHYGEITEIGEDYVVMDMRDDSYQTTGVLQRFTYTPDTYQSYESPFAQGSGCMLIAGEDGVALAMMEANG